MYGRDVFRILKRIGSVPESSYPYRADDFAPIPDKTLYDQAAKFRIANFARVITMDGLKRALLELGPCYLLLPLFKKRPQFWQGETDEEPQGGHAVTVVGYTTEGFILRNSWGDKWNGDGHVIFPYNDWSRHWECWVSVDAKSEKTMIDNDDMDLMLVRSRSEPTTQITPRALRLSSSTDSLVRKQSKCHCIII